MLVDRLPSPAADAMSDADSPSTPAGFARTLPPEADLWVFGYGSLMWDAGFPFAEQQLALLRGYHRRFCIYSMRHRGTPERPGLVFGLDHGGACRGIAYRVAAADVAGHGRGTHQGPGAEGGQQALERGD